MSLGGMPDHGWYKYGIEKESIMVILLLLPFFVSFY